MRVLVVVSSILACSFLVLSCSGRHYCENLESTARDPSAVAAMRTWAKRFEMEEVYQRNVQSDDGVGPGVRWLDHDINQELFGFEGNGHVRLVGPSPIDVNEGTVRESVRSLMFTERSRTGILFRLPGKTGFGLPSAGLTKISDDIAVLCDL